MIANTSGIVLSSLRYSDSSVIVRIYTKQIGLRSFMVRTGKGKAALPKLGLLQPLTLIEFSFENDERRSLRSVRSIERETMLNTIPFNTVKTCLALFMAEVIFRSIGEEEKNEDLFHFLQNSILLLDKEEGSVSNFHIKFMIEFSGFLGFYPHAPKAEHSYFDLIEGEFTSQEPLHPQVIMGSAVNKLQRLLALRIDQHTEVPLSNVERRILLQKLLDYYRLHLHGMKEITSHKVLEEVLS